MTRLVFVFVLISQVSFPQSRLDFYWAVPRKEHALLEAAQKALANVDYTSIREIAKINGHYLLLTTLRENDLEFSFEEWDRWEAFESLPDNHSVRSIWSGYRFTPLSSVPIRTQSCLVASNHPFVSFLVELEKLRPLGNESGLPTSY